MSVPLRDQQQSIKVPRFGSNCRFGLLLAGICAGVFALGLQYGSAHPGWLVGAMVFLLIAIAMPRVLAPLKSLWLKVGGFLHVIVSPVLLAGFYYFAIAPVGLIMQLLGNDPLRRKPSRSSYWIERDPPVTDPRSMPELF